MKNKISCFISFLLGNPLSFLRFLLSLVVGRSAYHHLRMLSSTANNAPYELSKTWITNILPDSLLMFGQDNYVFWSSLVVITAFGAAFGVLGRLNLLILAFLSFIIVGTVEGIGVYDHEMSLASQVILVLALVPGSMKLSFDYLIKYVYSRIKKISFCIGKTPKWSVNLVLLVLALTYLTAGISKVRYGGWEWFNGSTLGFYIQEKTAKFEPGEQQLLIGSDEILESDKWKDKFGLRGHAYGNYRTSKVAYDIGVWIVSKKPMLIFLSVTTVLFEVLGFIMFINGRYRNLFLLSAIILHTSIGFLMGLEFTPYRLICICLIDWKSIFKTINSKYKSVRLQYIK